MSEVVNPLSSGSTIRQSLEVVRQGDQKNPLVRLNSKCLKPTKEWSCYQISWVVLQTIVTSSTVFGINFGLTLLSFTGKEVSLFQFPIPMTGTYAIVILATTSANWLISGSLMSLDVVQGRVAPLDPSCFYYWPKKESNWHKFTQISELVCPGASNSSFRGRLISHAYKVLPWIAMLFVTLFPISIIISSSVWGDHGYHIFNLQPEIITAVVAVFSVLLTIPFWAIFALGNLGERYLAEHSDDSIS